MSLLVLLAQRMRRMLDMYFSIVRRRAAWASRVRESASWMTTTATHSGGEMIGAKCWDKDKPGRTLELLLRAEVHLLCLRDLLQDLLDDDAVIVSHFASCGSTLSSQHMRGGL